MKLSNHAAVPVYTISGSASARALPEWLARKRKRSLKDDPEYASRVSLLQDFEFEEASQAVRVSEDGNWVVSTGTYKPQIHVHNLPNLALAFDRHTESLNTTFELLSTDYSKSVHLQADRAIEFHTPEGCRYTTRIPRYGRDLKYSKRSTEVLVPTAGVNSDDMGEVFRLSLEQGKFLRPYEIEVGGDDAHSIGGGSLQGGVHAGSVNCAAIAEQSHNLQAFGTSLGTVEFWDPRMRDRAGTLEAFRADSLSEGRHETTMLEFHQSGLNIACGSSQGMIHIYDLRSPTPLLRKDQGYGSPIKKLIFLTPSATSRIPSDEPRILSADGRIIKIWDTRTGKPWTSVEPAVDLNDVAWCQDSGMLLTANEGRQQHAFFIPQLGPAPHWCRFLDNLVEEMAEDANDPSAFASGAGQVYENYKFLTPAQLESLNLAHLIGTTNLLRPYMHGFFVAQKLYEEARIVSDPFMLEDQRAKKVKEKLEKERESRIRGKKRVPGQVNKAFAAKILAKTDKEEDGSEEKSEQVDDGASKPNATELLSDPRFSRLFTDKSYAIDEASQAYKDLHPQARDASNGTRNEPRKLTAAEQEELEEVPGSSSSEEESEDNEPAAPRTRRKPRATHGAPRTTNIISSFDQARSGQDRSFGARMAKQKEVPRRRRAEVVGEQETTFTPAKTAKSADRVAAPRAPARKASDRRSASNNVFRKM